MIFPIKGVPISIEVMKTYFIPLESPLKGSWEEAKEHWARTLRSVWRRIPKVDQDIMLVDMRKYHNGRLSVRFLTEWEPSFKTNACIETRNLGVIAIDAEYARLADSRHLGATIAHELGHYRDFSGDNRRKLTESEAKRIAEETWGFPECDVIYKSEDSKQIDAVLKEEGITGGVFWDASWELFVYVKHKRRIRHSASYRLLNETAEDSLIHILDSGFGLSYKDSEAKARHKKRKKECMQK